MKLAAIYNVFDGLELLEGSIMQIRQSVDCVIIVAQEVSNFGEYDPFVYPYCEYLKSIGLVDHVIKYTPHNGNAMQRETQKRQIGIDFAKSGGYTHFFCLDCDEYYFPDELQQAKEELCFHGCGGAVVSMRTYYKSPSFMLENPESYYVPFIHTLHQNTTTGPKNRYPFYVDPTRKINTANVKLLDNIFMNHFSYIRIDIEKKINNSTARNNLYKKKYLYKEFNEAKAGDFIQLFEQKIIDVGDKFGIDAKIKEFKTTKSEIQKTDQG